MRNNNWTGERLETFIYNGNTIEHLHRYAIAGSFINDKAVLDIASGEGYGSFLMSNHASYVTGVDIDSASIEKANFKYQKDNLAFKTGSSDHIPLEDHSVDVVVSFETIEHHDRHEKMYEEIKRVLKPGGILIMSSPDKKYYSDKRNYKNPHHVKELYFEEFRKLASRFFKHISLFNQKMIFGSLIYPSSNTVTGNFQAFSGDYDLINESVDLEPLYNVVIACDHELLCSNISFFNGQDVLMKEYDELVKKVRGSIRYRVGDFLLKPFTYLSKFVKN